MVDDLLVVDHSEDGSSSGMACLNPDDRRRVRTLGFNPKELVCIPRVNLVLQVFTVNVLYF